MLQVEVISIESEGCMVSDVRQKRIEQRVIVGFTAQAQLIIGRHGTTSKLPKSDQHQYDTDQHAPYHQAFYTTPKPICLHLFFLFCLQR